MSAPAAPPAGLMSRSVEEIARALEAIRARRTLLTSHFSEVVFQSLLRVVDARAGRIVFERAPLEAANAALLARPRCTFHCDVPGWHIEFVAAAPHAVVHEQKNAIQCRFPDVLVSHQRREHGRVKVKAPLPLRVEADAGGIMPFEARIVDLAPGGVGFLIYAESITLEPGTVLRGCRIQLPGGALCTADFEVRYSQPVTLPNGRRAMRSGCRFVSPSAEVVSFVRRFLK